MHHPSVLAKSGSTALLFTVIIFQPPLRFLFTRRKIHPLRRNSVALTIVRRFIVAQSSSFPLFTRHYYCYFLSLSLSLSLSFFSLRIVDDSDRFVSHSATRSSPPSLFDKYKFIQGRNIPDLIVRTETLFLSFQRLPLFHVSSFLLRMCRIVSRVRV